MYRIPQRFHLLRNIRCLHFEVFPDHCLVKFEAMWTLAVIFLFSIFYILNQKFKTHRLYPPGPRAIPIVGHLFHVCINLRKYKFYHKVCQSWARQYGDIVGLKLGSVNIVVVSGKNFIREVSAREVFEGRPNGFFYLLRSFGKKLGIVFSDGPSWSKTRRFVLKYLKGFGYNTRFMETYIGEECRALVKLRIADAGTPVTVNHMFHVAILNILWQLVAGKRYDLEDERLKTLCDLITRSFKAVNMSGGILNFIPFIRHVLPDLSGYTELKSIHHSMHAFIEEIIKEHREKIDVKNPHDVIDAFLIEMMEHKDQTVTNEELQVVCLDLIEAGMETVTNTAVFMLLHIIRNAEVQKRLHAEIDEVIGRVRPPQLNDRTRMLYTEAVIQETLRISSVAAMGIPHMALEDARLGNYVVPKGTFILLSLHDLHNGEHWEDPDDFRPERFIAEDGAIIQNEWLLPFGIGKRRCIGEGLARSELFLFLTYILQEFHLKIPDGDPIPSAEPIDGVSLSAKPFRIVFQPRIN